MTEIVLQVEDAPEGGHTARAVGASIFTEADTIDSSFDAILGWHFDGAQQLARR